MYIISIQSAYYILFQTVDILELWTIKSLNNNMFIIWIQSAYYIIFYILGLLQNKSNFIVNITQLNKDMYCFMHTEYKQYAHTRWVFLKLTIEFKYLLTSVSLYILV